MLVTQNTTAKASIWTGHVRIFRTSVSHHVKRYQWDLQTQYYGQLARKNVQQDRDLSCNAAPHTLHDPKGSTLLAAYTHTDRAEQDGGLILTQ